MKLTFYPHNRNYVVSDCGDVFGPVAGAKRTGAKEIFERLNPRMRSGYLSVKTYPEQKDRLVHRMVLQSFRGECPDGMECSHLDGDAMNCKLSNLDWETKSQNQRRKHQHGTMPCGSLSPVSKLSEAEVLAIKASCDAGESYASVARRVGIHASTVRRMHIGERWPHLIEAARMKGTE